MKIGYISRRTDDNGKETFTYREGTATRRIGARSDTVKVKFLYGTLDYLDVLSTTKIIKENKEIMMVGEPFFTDEELKTRCEKWCEWANSCEHREYSVFGTEGL